MLPAVVVSIIGLFVGSFLNVLIFRFPKLRGVITGRSYCPNCKKTIRPYDLIPVISYLVLLGRCRDCGKKISLQYPLVELATGALFFLFAQSIGINYQLILYLLIASVS